MKQTQVVPAMQAAEDESADDQKRSRRRLLAWRLCCTIISLAVGLGVGLRCGSQRHGYVPNAELSLDTTFVGPQSPAMRFLGDKIGANHSAQSAGVSVPPWNGDGLPASLDANKRVPQEAFDAACITSLQQAFLVTLCTGARHLEAQVIADGETAIALGGRDCLTQRRYQKIFEGPPFVADEDIFVEMQRAACNLCNSLDDVSAGTVEYLYFLELNPRLQVCDCL